MMNAAISCCAEPSSCFQGVHLGPSGRPESLHLRGSQACPALRPLPLASSAGLDVIRQVMPRPPSAKKALFPCLKRKGKKKGLGCGVLFAAVCGQTRFTSRQQSTILSTIPSTYCTALSTMLSTVCCPQYAVHSMQSTFPTRRLVRRRLARAEREPFSSLAKKKKEEEHKHQHSKKTLITLKLFHPQIRRTRHTRATKCRHRHPSTLASTLLYVVLILGLGTPSSTADDTAYSLILRNP